MRLSFQLMLYLSPYFIKNSQIKTLNENTNQTNPTTADDIPYFLPNTAVIVGTPNAQNIPAA